jgi:hypothetical protein
MLDPVSQNLHAPVLAILAGTAFVAAMARGFSGFGGALIPWHESFSKTQRVLGPQREQLVVA